MHNGGTESHHELSPHDEPVMESGIAQSRGATFLYMRPGLRVKMCVWLGVSRGLDLAFLNAD